MPTGYNPAMHMPVRNLKKTIIQEVGSKNRIAILAPAATNAEAMKKRLGCSLSASPKKALPKVPTTYPTATMLLNSDALVSPIGNSSLRTGIIAVAENHSARAIASQATSKEMDGHFDSVLKAKAARWGTA
jgi:hypothetical protein